MKNFGEIHIVITKFLHLEKEGKLWSSSFTEWKEQFRIDLYKQEQRGHTHLLQIFKKLVFLEQSGSQLKLHVLKLISPKQ